MTDEDQSQKSIFLTLSELADLLRVAPATILRANRKGKIPGVFRIGHSLRFRVKELEHWMKNDDHTD